MLETSKKLFREIGEVGFLVSKLIEERPNDPLIAMIASKTAELTTTGMACMDKQRKNYSILLFPMNNKETES